MITEGIKGLREITVSERETARALGSGELDVLGTPALLAGIEETAWRSISGFLEEGTTTVGTRIEMNHLSATPVGMKVRFETEVTLVDRRRIVFRAEAYDASGKIAEGSHERFVVQAEKFQRKAEEKKEAAGSGD